MLLLHYANKERRSRMMRREICQIRLPEKGFNLEHSLNSSSSLLEGKELVYECCVYTHKDVMLGLGGNAWGPTAVEFPTSLPLRSCPCSVCHSSCSRAYYCWAILIFHGNCGGFLPFSFLFTVIWLRELTGFASLLLVSGRMLSLTVK